MGAFRLDSVAPRVAERFRRASAGARRRAALVTCEHAVAALGLSGADVALGLDVLRDGRPAASDLRQRLERRATELDDDYLRLDDAPDRKHDALHAFSKARAISALVFALSDDDANLHEAIYEALAAVDDPTPLLNVVERTLAM